MKVFKRIVRPVVSMLLVAVMLASFAACGEQSKKLGKVNDFTFDFQTGSYTFSGVEGAQEYRVRIFPVTDGKDEELPINESQPIRGGKETYSGTVALWSLTAGNTYNAYVLATGENGENSVSDAVTGVYIAAYDAIESGVQATIANQTITVSLDADALEASFDTGADYEITLKKGDTVVESKTLKNGDVVVSEDSSGGFSAQTTYDAEVTFEVPDDSTDYTVTVKVVSVSDVYISSEESEPFEVTEPAGEPMAPEMGEGMPEEGAPEEIPGEGMLEEGTDAGDNSDGGKDEG